MAKHDSIPPPKGTRDLYPEDLLRQRYITEAWRRVSIRHGFDEIAGPTFEMLDLYKKKSGEGIVSELFSFRRTGGDDDYALRPEFTPTLARMYAAKASALPSPCKWFTAGPYFRAEKPQRGRLREFLQWNCDVMGGASPEESASYEAEIIAVLLAATECVGLQASDLHVGLSNRQTVAGILQIAGLIDRDRLDEAFRILDQRQKLSDDQFVSQMSNIGVRVDYLDVAQREIADDISEGNDEAELVRKHTVTKPISVSFDYKLLNLLIAQLKQARVYEYVKPDLTIARGLAYYTGTVFELIADGERAVAGGGRYDNLIELFGGPPTPAVGFGMGDVVLGLLLEDKGLMPEGPSLMDALSQKPASLRPEAFVVASEQGEPHVEPLLAQLRRGVESDAWKQRAGKPWDADRYEIAPMHARRSYKSTKNIGKLLAEARKHHAKFAVIIDSADSAKIENLETREAFEHVPLERVPAKLGALLGP